VSDGDEQDSMCMCYSCWRTGEMAEAKLLNEFFALGALPYRLAVSDMLEAGCALSSYQRRVRRGRR